MIDHARENITFSAVRYLISSKLQHIYFLSCIQLCLVIKTHHCAKTSNTHSSRAHAHHNVILMGGFLCFTAYTTVRTFFRAVRIQRPFAVPKNGPFRLLTHVSKASTQRRAQPYFQSVKSTMSCRYATACDH